MLWYLIKVISATFFGKLYIINLHICDSWDNSMNQESDGSWHQRGGSANAEVMLFNFCPGFTHVVGWHFMC